MAKIRPYQQEQLASQVVGTAGQDQSGLYAATSAESDAAQLASAELSANTKIGNTQDYIASHMASQAEQGIVNYERAKADALKEQAKLDKAIREKSAKAIADDIVSGYKLQAAQEIQKVWEDPEVKRDPSKGATKVQQALADLYDKLPEMDQDVGALVHAGYNDERVKYGVQAETKAHDLRVTNAQLAIGRADQRRLDYGVAATQGDRRKFYDLVGEVNFNMGARIDAQGVEKAQQTATKQKEELGKRFMLLAVQEAPNTVEELAKDPILEKIVPEDDRNGMIKKANERIKALKIEAGREQRFALAAEINKQKQPYIHAMASDNANEITNTLHKLELTLEHNSKQSPDTEMDEETAKLNDKMLGWVKDLRGRLDHFTTEAAAERRHRETEANNERRHRERMAQEQNVRDMYTDAFIEGRSKADTAYNKARGKDKKSAVVPASAKGTEREEAEIMAAIEEQDRAYKANQFGLKTDKATAKEYAERLTYLHAKLDLNHSKQINRENPDYAKLINIITHHEAKYPPVPKSVADRFNPQGDEKLGAKVDLFWQHKFEQFTDAYRLHKKLPPSADISTKMLNAIANVTETSILTGRQPK